MTKGRTVRTDEAGDDRLVHGLVSPDAGEALIVLVTQETSAVAVPPPLRFPGLDPERRYRVVPLLAPQQALVLHVRSVT